MVFFRFVVNSGCVSTCANDLFWNSFNYFRALLNIYFSFRSAKNSIGENSTSLKEDAYLNKSVSTFPFFAAFLLISLKMREFNCHLSVSMPFQRSRVTNLFY